MSIFHANSRNFGKLLAFGSCLFFQSQVLAATELMTSKQLMKWIEENKVTTIPEFVEKVPHSLTSNRLEFYASRSLHCSSFSAPRVVFFNRSGQLVCSYNSGNSSDYAHITEKNCEDTLNKMECLEWDPKSETDRFFEIEFQKAEQAGKLPQLNSHEKIYAQKCAGCHFENPRRIINPYFTWPGTFGSSDDSHLYRRYGGNLPNSVEDNHYRQSYLPNLNPRYAKLPPHTALVYETENRPNLLATRAFTELHLRKLARRMREDRRLVPFQKAMLAATLCVKSSWIENEAAISQDILKYFPKQSLGSEQLLKIVNEQFQSLRSVRKNSIEDHIEFLGSLEKQERIATELLPVVKALDKVKGLELTDAGYIRYKTSSTFNSDDRYQVSTRATPDELQFYSSVLAILKVAKVDEREWSMNFRTELFWDPGNGYKESIPLFATELIRQYIHDENWSALFASLPGIHFDKDNFDNADQYGVSQGRRVIDKLMAYPFSEARNKLCEHLIAK